MSQPAEVLTQGNGNIRGDVDVTVCLKGLDSGTITYRDCDSRSGSADETLRLITGRPVPGFPGLTIQKVRSREVPGGYWDNTCDVEGLLDGLQRIIARRWRTSASGFDECTERRVLHKTIAALSKSTAQTDFPNMRLMDDGIDDQLDDTWRIIDYVFRGIVSDKLVLRKINADAQITSPSDPITVGLTGGWSDPRKSAVSLPQVTVEDTITSTDGPATDALPGAVTPPDPPAVQTISLSGTNLTWNWPAGWTLTSTPGTELYKGVGIWTYNYNYRWVYPAVY